jgi:hypothetical protein
MPPAIAQSLSAQGEKSPRTLPQKGVKGVLVLVPFS